MCAHFQVLLPALHICCPQLSCVQLQVHVPPCPVEESLISSLEGQLSSLVRISDRSTCRAPPYPLALHHDGAGSQGETHASLLEKELHEDLKASCRCGASRGQLVLWNRCGASRGWCCGIGVVPAEASWCCGIGVVPAEASWCCGMRATRWARPAADLSATGRLCA